MSNVISGGTPEELLQKVRDNPTKVIILVDTPQGIEFAMGQGLDEERAVFLLERAKSKCLESIDR
jgi:hypothetical protein